MFQFLVVLLGLDPLVWRRILVPHKYTFWDLHVAIQDAMGWTDHHLHEFTVVDPEESGPIRIGIPDDEFPHERPVIAGWDLKLSGILKTVGLPIRYVYDFGDNWEHLAIWEGYSNRHRPSSKPLCISGAGACPPEDCGGLGGYERFLEAVTKPENPEHDSMLEWVGGRYDSTVFVPSDVHFDDPRERWRCAFTEHGE